MIRMLSGHLGSGDWKLEEQDGITYLSHRLPFSPRNEYRIGSDQVLDVQVTEIKDQQRLVKITLSEERECVAQISEDELSLLSTLVDKQEQAPEQSNNTQVWVKALLGFLAVCIVFELFKHAL